MSRQVERAFPWQKQKLEVPKPRCTPWPYCWADRSAGTAKRKGRLERDPLRSGSRIVGGGGCPAYQTLQSVWSTRTKHGSWSDSNILMRIWSLRTCNFHLKNPNASNSGHTCLCHMSVFLRFSPQGKTSNIGSNVDFNCNLRSYNSVFRFYKKVEDNDLARNTDYSMFSNNLQLLLQLL